MTGSRVRLLAACGGLAAVCFAVVWFVPTSNQSPTEKRNPVPTAPVSGEGVVAATSGVGVVNIGAETLKKGGSAADVVLTVSLAQIAQVAGSYVSYADALHGTVRLTIPLRLVSEDRRGRRGYNQPARGVLPCSPLCSPSHWPPRYRSAMLPR